MNQEADWRSELITKKIWEDMQSLLFNREVVLIAGSYAGDKLRFTREERSSKFFVQLNHHWNRRFSTQPCDWLIARQGSGMVLESFLKIPEEHRKKISIISPQINEAARFEEWAAYCTTDNVTMFPFHEKGFVSINPYHPALEWCNSFWNEIKTNPFIGILAVKMILMFPIKSLELLGFDFFSNPDTGYRKNLSCHNVKRQVLWLLHQYNIDFRISVDKHLIQVFNDFGGINRGLIKTYDAASDDAGADIC